MSDMQTDDAPLSASKHPAQAVDAATDGMIADRGDTLVGRAVTINRPRGELYAYFRDFSNLATFMENIERVDVFDAKRSHWVVKAPAGRTVEWDASVVDEVEGEFFAWASEPGGDVDNSGRVEFRDAGARGTVVTATLLYDPPGGGIGKLIAKLFRREPAIQARRDLRRFKQLMETGEIATAARNRAMLAKEHE